MFYLNIPAVVLVWSIIKRTALIFTLSKDADVLCTQPPASSHTFLQPCKVGWPPSHSWEVMWWQEVTRSGYQLEGNKTKTLNIWILPFPPHLFLLRCSKVSEATLTGKYPTWLTCWPSVTLQMWSEGPTNVISPTFLLWLLFSHLHHGIFMYTMYPSTVS